MYADSISEATFGDEAFERSQLIVRAPADDVDRCLGAKPRVGSHRVEQDVQALVIDVESSQEEKLDRAFDP